MAFAAFSAWSNPTVNIGALHYKIDKSNGTAAVTYNFDASGFNYTQLSGNVSVPAAISVDGAEYTVTSVGPCAFESTMEITGIVLPETIMNIGTNAFYDCLKLESISIPGTIASIGSSAFANTSIRSVELTGTFESIPEYSFANASIERIVLPASVKTIGKGAFAGCGELQEAVLGDNVAIIAANAFKECKKLKSINFPDGLADIGDRAFKNCKSLASVTLKKAETIGESAFENCTTLTSLDLGNGNLSIGYFAFGECTGISEITIPSNTTEIAQYAFYNCTGIESVRFDDGDTPLSIGHAIFTNVPFADIYIGRDIVTKTSEAPFTTNRNIVKAEFGNSVRSIPSKIFRRSPKLREIIFGKNIATVGEEAFFECSELTTVYCADIADWCGIDFSSADSNPLSNGCGLIAAGELVTELTADSEISRIGENAFAEYGHLVAVTIPSSVNEIGQQAFMDCPSLEKVTFMGAVNKVGGRAFRNCVSLKDVYCTDLSHWMNCGFETSMSNPLYYGDKLHIGENTLAVLEAPEGTTSVLPYSFAHYSLLTEAILPASVKSIRENAFDECSALTEVTLGHSLESIGRKAFNGAPLSVINSTNPVPPTFPTSSTIAAFSNYEATVYVPTGSLEAYRSNECWKNFKTIVEKDFAGIDIIPDHAELPYTIFGNTIKASDTIDVYTVTGVKIATLTAGQSTSLDNGVYILYGIGKTYKILVR